MKRINKRDAAATGDEACEQAGLERRVGVDYINFRDLPDIWDSQPELRVAAGKRGEANDVGVGVGMAGVAGRQDIDAVAQPAQFIGEDFNCIRDAGEIRFVRVGEKGDPHSDFLARRLSAA